MSIFVKRAASPSHKLFYFIQLHPFSSSKSSLKESSFTVDYLINSCKFSPKKAIAASNYMKFEVADKPDSVLAFFKDHGFTQKQISALLNSNPELLVCNPQKTILPKLEFLKSKGISDSDIVAIVSAQPSMLRRKLQNGLMKSFNFLSSFLQSDQKTIAAFKRLAGSSNFLDADYVKTNIELLEKAGVPIKNIGYLCVLHPKLLMVNQDRLRQVLGEASRLGINSLKVNFVVAIHVLYSISKSTWDKKVEIYKQWGWSESDVVNAFNKLAMCMALSEDNITTTMDFLVNKMGMKALVLVDRPILLCLSLEKRIVPRCEVYQALVSKRVISRCDIKLASFLRYTVKEFEEKFINAHKEAYPELMKQYTQKVGACKSGSPLED